MAQDLMLQPHATFKVPDMGQFGWKIVSMGLAYALLASQYLVELVANGISNVVVYIDDLIIHLQTHDAYLKILDKVFTQSAAHNLCVNSKQCAFGYSETTYLYFWLLNFQGADKLKALRDTKLPEKVKPIWQFLVLRNVFKGCIQNFAHFTPPLTNLKKKVSGWK
jgi:hypothetical protein